MADNVIRTQDKRRWGFGGSAKEVKLATEKAGDAAVEATSEQPNTPKKTTKATTSKE